MRACKAQNPRYTASHFERTVRFSTSKVKVEKRTVLGQQSGRRVLVFSITPTALGCRVRPRMERVQLFEFEDLPWFPQVVRECMTDFLSFLGQRGRVVYQSFAERLAAALAVTGDDT